MKTGFATIERISAGAGVAEFELLRAMEGAGPTGHLAMDVMNWEGPAAIHSLHSTLESGTTIRMLSSPLHEHEGFVRDLGLQEFADNGHFEMLSYRAIAKEGVGPNGLWQHSKLMTNLDPRNRQAWFSNVAPWGVSPTLEDITVQLGGTTRDAAIRVSNVWSHGGSPRQARGAVDRAARAGLLFNDPHARRYYISDAFDSLARSAHNRLLLMVKGLDDEQLSHEIVAAHQSGARVAVVAHNVGEASAKILSDAEVPTLVSTGHWANRINFILADDRGMVTTAYPIRDVLRGGTLGMTAGRESALMLNGSALDRVAGAAMTTSAGRAGHEMLSLPPEMITDLLRAPGSFAGPYLFSGIHDPIAGANILGFVG